MQLPGNRRRLMRAAPVLRVARLSTRIINPHPPKTANAIGIAPASHLAAQKVHSLMTASGGAV